MFVFDERKAHVSITEFAKPNTWRHRNLGIGNHALTKLDGSHVRKGFRNSCPDKHRSLGRWYIPPGCRQSSDQGVSPLSIDFHDLSHHRITVPESDDGRDLNGLEDTIIKIALETSQRGNHL